MGKKTRGKKKYFRKTCKKGGGDNDNDAKDLADAIQ